MVKLVCMYSNNAVMCGKALIFISQKTLQVNQQLSFFTYTSFYRSQNEQISCASSLEFGQEMTIYGEYWHVLILLS